MRVLRGRGATPAADGGITTDALALAVDTNEAVVRVWQPHRQVAFGLRDTHAEGYPAARRVATDHGFEPVERSVGGRAVACTGSTLAFARCQPVEDQRSGLRRRYRVVTRALRTALETLGVDASVGEPDGSFCPGPHSLRADGKIVGVAQRVRGGAALVSGIVVVDDGEAIAGVLEPVYAALGLPFDTDAVGSVAAAGGPRDPAHVARVLEEALADDAPRTVERVGYQSVE